MHEYLSKKSPETDQDHAQNARQQSSLSSSPDLKMATAAGPHLTPTRILALQRTMGNRYVTAMIQRTLSSRA